MSLTKGKFREIAAALAVFDYPDYRAFLVALYEAAKAADDAYSYARLSLDLGLASTNAHGVIQGRRALSEKTGTRICEVLDLKAQQRKYFLTLIRQEHGKTAEEREQAFRDRISLKQKQLEKQGSALDQQRLAFFEHWYNGAILELLRIEAASDDPQWIAARLQPTVSLVKIKESLELLISLGYLAVDAKRGRLFPTQTLISTGDEVARLGILSYHRQMLELAVHAMDFVDSADRDISAVTLMVNGKLHEQMKNEIIAMRKRFLKLAEQEPNGNEILQINLQLFPLTRRSVGK